MSHVTRYTSSYTSTTVCSYLVDSMNSLNLKLASSHIRIASLVKEYKERFDPWRQQNTSAEAKYHDLKGTIVCTGIPVKHVILNMVSWDDSITNVLEQLHSSRSQRYSEIYPMCGRDMSIMRRNRFRFVVLVHAVSTFSSMTYKYITSV